MESGVLGTFICTCRKMVHTKTCMYIACLLIMCTLSLCLLFDCQCVELTRVDTHWNHILCDVQIQLRVLLTKYPLNLLHIVYIGVGQSGDVCLSFSLSLSLSICNASCLQSQTVGREDLNQKLRRVSTQITGTAASDEVSTLRKAAASSSTPVSTPSPAARPGLLLELACVCVENRLTSLAQDCIEALPQPLVYIQSLHSNQSACKYVHVG